VQVTSDIALSGAACTTVVAANQLVQSSSETDTKDAGLANVQTEVRDFVDHGTGVPDSSQGHVMVFNLLHIEDPLALLREAHRALKPGGFLSVIHWRSDLDTPRGPPLALRPKQEQCAGRLAEAGFHSVLQEDLGSSAPYQFGILARRAAR